MQLYLYGWAWPPRLSGEIVRRKRSFSKTLFKPEEFEASRFSIDGEHFENGAFRKRS